MYFVVISYHFKVLLIFLNRNNQGECFTEYFAVILRSSIPLCIFRPKLSIYLYIGKVTTRVTAVRYLAVLNTLVTYQHWQASTRDTPLHVGNLLDNLGAYCPDVEGCRCPFYAVATASPNRKIDSTTISYLQMPSKMTYFFCKSGVFWLASALTLMVILTIF